ncbi:MAG: thiamine phosphate synthase [Thioalkalivibrionaceae bacterium]
MTDQSLIAADIPVAPRGLYWIAPSPPDEACRLVAWWKLVDAVLAARPACVQWRDKSSRRDRDRQRLAADFGTAVRAAGSRWIVNDDVAIALELGADGIHLGQSDLDRIAAQFTEETPAQAQPCAAVKRSTPQCLRGHAMSKLRQMLGSRRSFGITCHNRLDLAAEAAHGTADLLAFGAFFPSMTKPEAFATSPASLELLSAARQAHPDATICAIGGITAAHAPALYAAGTDLIAVSSAISQAADPTAAAQAFAPLNRQSL